MVSTPLISDCTIEDRQLIGAAINAYNFEHVPATTAEHHIRLEYVAKDTGGKVLGGIIASLGYWGGLEVHILWVDETQRNKGLGTILLKHLEQAGIEKGAKIAILDTFDFQAKDFYLKNGYVVFGELQDFPKGHSRYYLSRKLTGH